MAVALVLGVVGGGAPPVAASSELAAVAAAHGRSEAQVARLLADPTARVGATGRLYYEDAALPEPEPEPVRPRVAAARFPHSETFLLHSRRGSPRVIYLDFDGHTVAGTAWNSNDRLGTPASFYAEPYSKDADPSFDGAERDVIQAVWEQVAEDFAVFDVDVTTQDPGEEALTRTGLADQEYGTRALITNTKALSACTCGGSAYLDVFDHTSRHAYFQPAFVLSTTLSSTRFLADAVSHEVGHNLDLKHDGTVGPDGRTYYPGHDAWGPIMGSSSRRPITQWSRGEYAAASNTEDDLAVIQSNGLARLADDAGDVPAAANSLAAGPSMSASGIITTDEDVDVFRVLAGAGPASFWVAPAPNGPNLDLQLELRAGDGSVIAAADPPSTFISSTFAHGLDASVSVTLPSNGAYYLVVTGVGTGDPTTGYSGYGSIGRYALSGFAAVPPPVAPDPPPPPAAVPGDGLAHVSWRAPNFDGYSPISSYTVRASPGGAAATVEGAARSATIAGLANGVSHTFTVTATNAVGGSVPSAAAVVAPRGFTPLSAPARLLDTRGAPTIDGLSSGPGVLAAASTTELVVGGRAGIAASAVAVVLNVTAVGPATAGFVTVFPCGRDRPQTSNVNYVAGDVVANAVVTGLGPAGRVCLYTSASTHLVVDASGWVSPGSSPAPPPARLLDTRPAATIDGLFSGTGAVSADSTLELVVAGRGGIGAGAAAVALNVTVAVPAAAGYVTVFPCGRDRPQTSNVNYVAGDVVANAVMTGLGTGGKVCLYSSAAAHLIVDSAGAMSSTALLPLPAPSRFLDTRAAPTFDGQFSATGAVAAGATVELVVAGRGGIAAGAGAVALNVTAVGASDVGFVTVYPCSQARPNASNVNYGAGDVVANAVMTGVGTSGRVCLYTSATTHLVADVAAGLV